MIDYLKGAIDRVEEDLVVVKLENGEHLHWPVETFPFVPKVGGEIKLRITNEGAPDNSAEEAAKKLLNELLETN